MDELIDLPASGGFGILSRPAQGTPKAGLVLFSAGLLHRPGPWRLHTHLARHLAADGMACLRFDQPGVGDTLGLADRRHSQIGADVVDAFAAATGCRSIAVGGLCAGADLGWQVALRNDKVGALLLLDPYAHAGWWHRWARLRRRLGRALGRGRPQAGPESAPSPDPAPSTEPRPAPTAPGAAGAGALRDWPEAGARTQMDQLVARRVAMLAVYTGGASRYFLHPRQFRATYGPGADDPHVRLAYWPDCDHLFYAPEQRRRLIRTVADWLPEAFRR